MVVYQRRLIFLTIILASASVERSNAQMTVKPAIVQTGTAAVYSRYYRADTAVLGEFGRYWRSCCDVAGERYQRGECYCRDDLAKRPL